VPRKPTLGLNEPGRQSALLPNQLSYKTAKPFRRKSLCAVEIFNYILCALGFIVSIDLTP
jgi:hypothetical protein